MNVAAHVARIRNLGLTIELASDGKVRLQPESKRTNSMVLWLTENMEEVITYLRSEQTSPADCTPPDHAQRILVESGPIDPFHKVPNVIWDRLVADHALEPYSTLLLLYLCRKINGWHKEARGDTVSLNQAAQALRCGKTTIVRALDQLEGCGLIRRERTFRKPSKSTGIVKPMPAATRIWLTLPAE